MIFRIVTAEKTKSQRTERLLGEGTVCVSLVPFWTFPFVLKL